MIAMAITLEFLILMCFHDCEVPTCNCNLQGKMNFIASMAFVVLVVHINVNNAVKVTDMPETLEFLQRGAVASGYGRYHGILYECHVDNWQVCEPIFHNLTS